MFADSFFIKGSAHPICEDYACHSQENLRATLSDGCSTAKNAHIGAMLLAEAALIDDEVEAVVRAAACLKLIDKPLECLHATLGEVYYSEEYNRIYSNLQGDGTLYTPDTISTIEYSPNTPFYPLYTISHYKTLWELMETNITKIGTSSLSHPNLSIIFSDGVSSFVDCEGNSVPTQSVVSHLTDFKSYGPSFIRRRANRCFTKVFPDLGWRAIDDVSIAGIYKE